MNIVAYLGCICIQLKVQSYYYYYYYFYFFFLIGLGIMFILETFSDSRKTLSSPITNVEHSKANSGPSCWEWLAWPKGIQNVQNGKNQIWKAEKKRFSLIIPVCFNLRSVLSVLLQSRSFCNVSFPQTHTSEAWLDVSSPKRTVDGGSKHFYIRLSLKQQLLKSFKLFNST